MKTQARHLDARKVPFITIPATQWQDIVLDSDNDQEDGGDGDEESHEDNDA